MKSKPFEPQSGAKIMMKTVAIRMGTYTAVVLGLLAGASLAQAADAAASKATVVYDHVLPNAPGKSIKGVLVEYAPGGTSPAHHHAKSAFIYATVLEGEIRSQVNGGPVTTYRVGESFTELPGDRHSVSENASKTAPARLLAVFVVDTDDKVLTTTDPK
jgi:quercetin dioxygenase-like cupin family protein